jgi:hypothetical protein
MRLSPALTPGQRRRLDAGASAVIVAKAYRLLKAIFYTAWTTG